MARQYFYLVAVDYDECTFPQKIFFQEHEAIQWGRREATKTIQQGLFGYEYKLFRQEITRNGRLEKIKYLRPYNIQDIAKEKIIPRQPDDDIFGADYDIDAKRL